MKGFILHNSADENFRTPLGALNTGESVTLSLYLQAENVKNVFLKVYCENNVEFFPMTEENCIYSATIYSGDVPCVKNYVFKVVMGSETFYYSPKDGHTCGIGDLFTCEKSSYQITVVKNAFKTPDCFKGALMYQIFPDRFCVSGENLSSGKEYHEKKGRTVYIHKDLSEKPDYLPRAGEKDYSPIDFYGGDLKGIASKLSYLNSLGVEVIYLNPVFEAYSNHRYNTADYMKIDPFLGNDEDFIFLCCEAKKFGIKIIFDGVFSHTGSDSIYFKDALMNGKDGKYYSWYTFYDFPDKYNCWWGFKTLPTINKSDSSWREFAVTGEDSVIKHWLKKGASGIRLDVADELPDEVIELMRASLKQCGNDNLLLGEVWEDATTKESYNKKRTYALGSGLDSVMNYPLRTAVIDFLKNIISAAEFAAFLTEQQQNYPKEMYYCLMNLLSSHDVERMRTVLGLEEDASAFTREEQANVILKKEEDEKASALMRLAASIIMTVPGIPSVYYGDETGMNGLKDPFNREFFYKNDAALTEFYKKWGRIHKEPAFKKGFFAVNSFGEDIILLLRFNIDNLNAFYEKDVESIFATVINRSDKAKKLCIDLHSFKNGLSLEARRYLKAAEFNKVHAEFSGKELCVYDGLLEIEACAYSAECYKFKKE